MDPDHPAADSTFRLTRKYCLILAYVISGIGGIAQVVSPMNGLFALLSSLLFATLLTLATIADSRILRRPMIHILQVIYFFTWPLASLIYLMATRGWRGVGTWLIHAVGFYATSYVMFYLTFFAASWAGWFEQNPIAAGCRVVVVCDSRCGPRCARSVENVAGSSTMAPFAMSSSGK